MTQRERPPRRVIICSPWRGDTERHARYLDACLRDSYARGESPYASHAIGPRVLDDADPEQRRQGSAAGLAWIEYADALALYVDLGVSEGMGAEIQEALDTQTPIEERTIPGWEE